METTEDIRSTNSPLSQLYQTSPPVVSPIWRLHFVNPRESSHNDVFALLHYIDLHIAINVLTVIRTWNNQIPIYWILFETDIQALVARGFAVDAEGEQCAKVTGTLVPVKLFRLAEEEEYRPTYATPLEPNRWDHPLRIYAAPLPSDPSPTPPSTPSLNTMHEDNSKSPEQQPRQKRPLLDRIQHASLLERLS